MSVLGWSSVDGKRNNVVTVGGATIVDKSSHDNTILNAGGLVTSSHQKDDPGALSLSVCGNAIGALADHITVTDLGVCSGDN